ncbi:hypothetical protein FY534_01735 [Alicyclobacillus sp. TC]|nr:hypothetical protein FY534_01735 [Alicyclobacillus sp. TC]
MAQELSGIETSLRLILEWSDSVREIKEQVALDVDETLAIADELGIEHPSVDGSPKVMTSDFVVEMTNNEVVVVQTKSWTFTLRDVEKMEIERAYWLRRNARWMLVTDLQIPDVVVSNVRDVRKYVDLTDYHIPEKHVSRIRRVAEPLIVKDIPMNEVGVMVDERLGYEYGTSLTVFRHLIAKKEWIIDMFEPIDPGSRLRILSIAGRGMDKEASAE